MTPHYDGTAGDESEKSLDLYLRFHAGGLPGSRYISVEGNADRARNSDSAMVFDLICRSCGACAQRAWDPTAAVGVTLCGTCDAAMSVIGIDFPRGRQSAALNSVLEVIQGAGIVPVAVERHARGRLSPRAA